MESLGRLHRHNGIHLAWDRIEGRAPTVVFLPGYRSDMTGDKATNLAEYCAKHGQAMLRFDYSGHGASDGIFEDGTIGSWTEDALAAIDALTEGALILVGSSMGGWIALLVTIARAARVAGVIGIAAAPDFTETLMWNAMTLDERATLTREGVLHVPSQYGEPLAITRLLIEEGRRHMLLQGPIPVECPVRLLHGQRDSDVPWETALRIGELVRSEDVRVTLVKDGDHRLSRPIDLEMLRETLQSMLVHALSL